MVIIYIYSQFSTVKYRLQLHGLKIVTFLLQHKDQHEHVAFVFYRQ